MMMLVDTNSEVADRYERVQPKIETPSMRTKDVRPAVRRQLAVLERLQPNWDSYGGAPVAAAAIEAVTQLFDQRPYVREPFIAPVASGGLLLEWTAGAVEIEAEFDRDGVVSVLWTGPDEQSEEHGRAAASLLGRALDAVAV
jgi:hypothetical protein